MEKSKDDPHYIPWSRMKKQSVRLPVFEINISKDKGLHDDTKSERKAKERKRQNSRNYYDQSLSDKSSSSISDIDDMI